MTHLIVTDTNWSSSFPDAARTRSTGNFADAEAYFCVEASFQVPDVEIGRSLFMKRGLADMSICSYRSILGAIKCL